MSMLDAWKVREADGLLTDRRNLVADRETIRKADALRVNGVRRAFGMHPSIAETLVADVNVRIAYVDKRLRELGVEPPTDDFEQDHNSEGTLTLTISEYLR